MKVRTGFVSNSSSSSFIVAFDKVPESADELRVMMFGDADTFYAQFYDGYPVSKVTETVWDDLQETKPLKPEEVIEAFDQGYIYEVETQLPKYPWADKPETMEESRQRWNEYDRQHRAVTEPLAKKFIADHPNATFYRFEYSDNDGSYFGAMEHGGLFDRLPHQTISHH